MRRTRTATLFLTLISATVLLLAGGVALAAVITCPTGPGGQCRGTPEADEITGASGADTIYALDGNDSALGGRGDDFIQGNEDDDRELSGNQGQDEIHGGLGDDIDLDGDARDDKIYGDKGNDLELDGDKGNDELHGGPGDDGGPPTSENIRLHGLRGEGGENRVYGEDGADTINAQLTAGLGGAPERIFGGEGDDTIAAADRVKDVIDCGLGRDTVFSYDTGLDVLVDCEATSPEAATVVGN